jgi:hypothetical protein
MDLEPASLFQRLGAGGFGFLIGWNLYFVNRYRSGPVTLGDLASLVGTLGGTAVLALFPARSDLFGAYGIGLFAGFFGYFALLAVLVARSKNFDVDWFLDGRRKQLAPDQVAPDTGRTVHAMPSKQRLPG